ncbi:MAG: hypothetical protein IH965_04365 [Gemmatimonadetes bacterium]|nr:hypothetical protein [Gemmatimonadota bacterium]
MRRAGVAGGALLLAVTSAAGAQTVRIGIHGVGISHVEVRQERRAEGGGIGGYLSVRVGRFGLDLSGHAASIELVDVPAEPFDVLQGDARLSYAVARSLAIEVGAGRRKIDPEFTAQDVSVVRAGLLSEVRLSSIGSVWGRGAYLVSSRFNGGGEAGLALELGLGVALGTANGRFRVRVEYEFQRIDREVETVKVPIQVTIAKLGLDLGF